MKYLILLVLLLPIPSNAQDSLSRMFVGGQASLNWCDRKSVAEENVQFLKENFDEIESGRLGYAAGVALQYKLTKKLFIHSGINYTLTGYNIDTLESAGMSNIQCRFHYLEVPVSICYAFGRNETIQPILALGISGRMLTSSRQTFQLEGQTPVYMLNQSEAYTPFAFTLQAGAGFRKSVQSKFDLICIVHANQSITPLIDSPFKRYMNAAGILIALTKSI